ncbi:MAG: endonuclease/exonuclease/phosphatase family protein [Tenacibaculum sp.]|nr:endonuclease/exonuclease/phosphatase family protein [Tenacibaculum sp.]
MKKSFLIFVLILSVFTVFSQEKGKKYDIRTIAFYNLENLFDTTDDPTIKDELSPIMEIKGNRSKIYKNKINNLSYVISQIGKGKTKTSPTILGVCEVENSKVLEDLVNSKKLKNKNYGIIHFNSPDHRGIDVGLLYQQKYFKPIHYEVFNPNIYLENQKINTRDILLVSGYLDDELIHIIVNHWPSRRGGELETRPMREKSAYKVTQIIEKIRENDKNAKIIIMGDFNDDPISKSFKDVLKTKKKRKKLKKNDIFNPYEKMFSKGLSTLGYRDNINLFDQILLTSSLVNKKKNNDFSSYKMFKSAIFNKRFLTQRKGKYKGYPFRSFSKGQYTGGYSDHYPVYIYLIKQRE